MITVKMFGLLRLESGIKELQLEADTMKQVYAFLLASSDKLNKADLESCLVLINGTEGNHKSKLNDGDVVIFMSPVAGG